jgi:hypothetical protein
VDFEFAGGAGEFVALQPRWAAVVSRNVADPIAARPPSHPLRREKAGAARPLLNYAP